MKITSAGTTNIGRKRKANQDSFLMEPGSRLFVVADGMGGHAGGEIASAMAVEVLEEHAGEPSLENLMEAARLGNRAIFEKAGGDAELHGMGTTLCAVRVVPGADGEGDEIAWINVGDSRVYLFRDDRLIQLSRDRITYALILAVPVIQMLLFGYAINTDPRHLPTALLVQENSVFARSADCSAPSISRFSRSVPSSLRWSMSSDPMIGVNRLLKSCATPPVRLPIASIFWLCRSASCAASSCASRALTWLRSRPTAMKFRPSGSGATVHSMDLNSPSLVAMRFSKRVG